MRRNKPTLQSTAVSGIVSLDRGLSSGPAREVCERAREFESVSTIETKRGRAADATELWQLLLLGVAAGEAVTVRCRGIDAPEAFRSIVAILERDHDREG